MNKENLSLATNEEKNEEGMETEIPSQEAKSKSFDQAKVDIAKDRGFFERVKTGFKSKPLETQIAKTTLSTVASIAGVKSFYDVPEYFRERFKVRGLFGKGKGMAGSVEDLLAANRQRREKASGSEITSDIEPGQIENKEIEKSTEVKDAIADLNKRLALTREGTVKGSEQRKLLAKLLRENRIHEKHNQTERQQEMTNILDQYTTTKVTGIQAARESLNTFFVASGAYGLRGISYGILDGVERYQRLNKEAKNKGESVDFLKNVVLDSFKETWDEIRLKDESGKKSFKQKGLSAVKAWGKIARYAGMGVMAQWHPETAGNSIDKALAALQGKVSFSDVAQNYKGNIERLYQFYSKTAAKGANILFTAGNREAETAEEMPSGRAKTGLQVEELKKGRLGIKDKPLISHEKSPKDGLYDSHSGKTKLNINEVTQPERSKAEIKVEEFELGKIKKGQGIEHALIRQLIVKKQEYGYVGDVNNKAQITKWAETQAHKIAIKMGYVDTETGREVRVRPIDKAAYILENKDGNISIKEYLLNKKTGKFDQVDITEAGKGEEMAFQEKPDEHEYIHTPDKKGIKTDYELKYKPEKFEYKLEPDGSIKAGVQSDEVADDSVKPPAEEIPEVERPKGDPLPVSFEEMEKMGLDDKQIYDLTSAAKNTGKYFVSGTDFEDYSNKLRDAAHQDNDVTDETGRVINNEQEIIKSVPTAESLSGRLDKMIADTMSMKFTDYDKVKSLNLNDFIGSKKGSWLDHNELKPIRKIINEYLKLNDNKVDPEHLKGTVGKFLKDIIRIDIGAKEDKIAQASEAFMPSEDSLKEIVSQATPQEAAELAKDIAPERIEWLDKILESKLSDKVGILAQGVKDGKLTAEDFSKYYSGKIGSKGVSDEILNNIKNNFKAINQGGSTREKADALRALKALIHRIESKAE